MTRRTAKHLIGYLSGVLICVVSLEVIIGTSIHIERVTPLALASTIDPVAQPDNVQLNSSKLEQSIPKPAVFTGAHLYADPQAHTINGQPTGKWFTGDGDMKTDVDAYVSAATAANAVPLLVLYNIPQRDCSGGYSAGGAATSDAYTAWISQTAAGIGARTAIVILEPDSIAGAPCLAKKDQTQRLRTISEAVTTLKTNPRALVYIDGGNARWQKPSTMAPLLKAANIATADGFAINVSNFVTTAESTAYGEAISQQVGGKHFVIDTSRNGNGPAPHNEWCNPAGRALGKNPTLATGVASVDAYLWVKVPGESDGTCNGGPSAGVWWQAYADGLVR